MVLWDLAGKALGVPIHTLLGGNVHSKVKVYADCHAGEAVTSLESYSGDSESYTPEAYAANGLDWIENPVQGTNVEALAEVTRSTAIPVLYSYTQPRNMRRLAREETTLFYGWHSNRTRGYRKRHGLLGDASRADPAADESDGTPLEVRRSWAHLIRQVYEVDPLLCSQCWGT